MALLKSLETVDDVSGFGEAIKKMVRDGITKVYDMNHIVLGEGNFILAINEGKFAGNHTSFL